MKNQENKKSKKKVLLYYLILAACLLVIAAVTVTVIFAVNRSNKNNLSVDVGVEQPDDPNNPDNPDDPDEPNKPSSSVTTFLMPTTSQDVATTFDLEENATLGCYRWHKGMDFAGNAGDNVYSVLDGKVTKIIYNSPSSALLDGGCVTIEHANGVTTIYKFVDIKEGLKVGDTVSRGDTIGTIMAATGSEMELGDHLHFEVKVNGKYADPAAHLELIEK